jgi:hypothetical protein
MPIKPLLSRHSPALIFGAAGILAGFVGLASANAASSAVQNMAMPVTNQQAVQSHMSSPWMTSITRVADNDGDNDKSGSSSAMKKKKAKRTNQTTGAADSNPGSMSEQKGNQPKSAVKTD